MKTKDQILKLAKEESLEGLTIEEVAEGGYLVRFQDFTLPCLNLDQAYIGIKVIGAREDLVEGLVPYLNHFKAYFLSKGVGPVVEERLRNVLDSIKDEATVKVRKAITEALENI